MNIARRLLPTLSIGVCAGLMGAAGLDLWRADGVLVSGLESALERLPPAATGAAIASPGAAFDPSALRLSRHDEAPGHGLSGAIAVGDHVTFGGSAGRLEALVVVSVADVPVDATRVVGDQAGPQLKLVTARVVGGDERGTPRTVRFVIETEGTPPLVPATAVGVRPPKAL